LDEALAIEAEAVRESEAQGVRRMEGGSRHYLAMIHEQRGQIEQAEQQAVRAAELLEIAPALRAYALATVARIRLARGNVAAALVASHQAMNVLDSLGAIEEGEASVRLTRAQVLRAAGRDEEAFCALEAARERLVARADRIHDPAWRRSFLANVPEHQSTFAGLD
jgi:tetratricopeptide (TPR) repeat protein